LDKKRASTNLCHKKISIEHNFSKMMDLLAAANRQAPRPSVHSPANVDAPGCKLTFNGHAYDTSH
jgi:hypothetical protein